MWRRDVHYEKISENSGHMVKNESKNTFKDHMVAQDECSMVPILLKEVLIATGTLI